MYDTGMECDCSRKCHEHFSKEDNADITDQARQPLYDANMHRDTMRGLLRENWQSKLQLPDGRPCCFTMACEIYSCSRAMLRPDKKRPNQTRSEASSHCPKASAICSWFYTLRKTLDVMPDEGGWRMVNYPRRKYLFEAYCDDHEAWPDLYPEVT